MSDLPTQCTAISSSSRCIRAPQITNPTTELERRTVLNDRLAVANDPLLSSPNLQNKPRIEHEYETTNSVRRETSKRTKRSKSLSTVFQLGGNWPIGFVQFRSASLSDRERNERSAIRRQEAEGGSTASYREETCDERKGENCRCSLRRTSSQTNDERANGRRSSRHRLFCSRTKEEVDTEARRGLVLAMGVIEIVFFQLSSNSNTCIE